MTTGASGLDYYDISLVVSTRLLALTSANARCPGLIATANAKTMSITRPASQPEHALVIPLQLSCSVSTAECLQPTSADTALWHRWPSCRWRMCSTNLHNQQSCLFCQSPNVYGGKFCTNTDGPGTVSTSGTQQFKSTCPAAYSYSKDDATSTNACTTGTNYNFKFCP